MDNSTKFGAALLAISAAIASPGVAQEMPAQGAGASPAAAGSAEIAQDAIGDIVVTAQRRTERLQDVPLAVTAVGSERLAASGVSNSMDLKLISPSVDVPVAAGYVTPYIRGIGSRALGPGVENPVAIYVDGVYIAAPASSLISLNNVERVEVLKGPQGTLFGRNASAGLIQIVTRDPKDEFGGEVNVGYGNYDTSTGDFYVTGGITEGVKADLAGFAQFQGDGYGTNLFNGKDVYRTKYNYGLRSKWLLEPADGVTIRIAADYGKLDSSQNVQRLAFGETYPPPFGPVFGGSHWDTNLDVQPRTKNEQGGASIRLDVDTGFATFVSTTAYRKSRFFLTYDADISASAGRSFFNQQDDRQFSQELQLISNGNSSLSWTAGLFYWNAAGKYDPFDLNYLGVLAPPTFNQIFGVLEQKVESVAPYAQATYEFLPKTRLTLGLRYTYEARRFNGYNDGLLNGAFVFRQTAAFRTADAKKVTWRVALDHKFSDDTLVYASQGRGFKSGGFSPQQITVPPYQPETLDSYEVGLKTALFDRALRVDTAAFYYNYKDAQIYGNNDRGVYTTNGGKARVYGFEFEASARPFKGLNLSASYTYLDTKWQVFPNSIVNLPNPAGGRVRVIQDVKGNELPNAPHHSFNVSGSYQVPIGDNTLTFNGNVYYNSGFFGEADNIGRQDAYALVNASVRFALADDRLVMTLWGKNLTNQAVDIYPSSTPLYNVGPVAYSVERSTFAPPRTYGFTVGTKF